MRSNCVIDVFDAMCRTGQRRIVLIILLSALTIVATKLPDPYRQLLLRIELPTLALGSLPSFLKYLKARRIRRVSVDISFE